MKQLLFVLAVVFTLNLLGCTPEEIPPETTLPTQTVPETTEPTTPETTAPVLSGWIEEESLRRYYQDGVPLTGWQRIDGELYYFHDDGAMATGEVSINGQTYHFTSQGKRVILVNPWNYVPEDYEPTLVSLSSAYGVQGSRVDFHCYADLMKMIDDCNKVCPQVYVVSSYRTHEHQTNNYNNKVRYYMNLGYSREDAEKEAATIIAVPGTSEHQLGLAVDIIDTRLWSLVWEQEELPAQQWLMENCWKYGFILRYPKDKIDVTGIIYEPWHYRYVGYELAQELHESGQTLEEYLHSLTPAVG